MLAFPAAIRIYVAIQPVDMRKSFNGLWSAVCEQLQEDPKTVALLFELMNLIVDNQISQPKAVQELYGKLPQGAVEAIKKRDGNANN